MAQSCIRGITAVVVLFAFLTSSALGQNSGAILYPSGGVTLNGSPLVLSSAVTTGNKVHTGASPALLTIAGSSVQILANTTIVFDSVMGLGCGGAVVTTSRGLAVRAAGVTVAGTSDNANFEILNGAGKVEVTLRAGTAHITDANGTSALQAGQSVSRPGDAACPAFSPTPSSAPQAAATKGISHKALMIGGIAGGGAAAAAILLTRESVSPSRP